MNRPFDIAGLDHVVLRLNDIPAALHFYGEILGCTVEKVQENLGLTQLRAGADLIDLVDVAGPFMEAARVDGRVVDGVELVLYPGKDPMGYYGVTDPTQIEWMKSKLTPHPWKCFEQKLVLTNENAMRKIPESHIVCTQTLPTRDVETLKARSEGRLWDVNTGHDLMISEPAAVAELLLRLA